MGQYPLLRCGDATIGPFSSGVVVRGSGSAQWWERAGAEAVRMGLLGRSGAGACPDLLQRRPGPGSAARRSAEYQRFSSGAPARSGPLQQIWTTCAAAVLPGGRPRVGRRPRRAPLTPRRALRTRECSSNRCSRKQNAHLEGEVHISTRRGPVAVAAPRGAGPAPEHLQ